MQVVLQGLSIKVPKGLQARLEAYISAQIGKPFQVPSRPPRSTLELCPRAPTAPHLHFLEHMKS
jgi:hypothetical protein